MKVLGFIGDFFQKSPMQVRTESATFPRGADRVAVPSGSREYLSVCKRNFPMQADVTVKQKTVAKLS